MKLTVTLQVDDRYPSHRDVTVCRHIAEDFHAMVPLDLPSPDADGLDRMMCTDAVTIERVMRSRTELSRILGKELTRALLDAMGARDTVMGYPK